MDVAKAFKRIAIHPNQRHKCAIRINNKVFIPKVLLFGLSASGYWWARLASVLHRIMHKLIDPYHCGLVFVDDSLWLVNEKYGKFYAVLLVTIY